MTADSTPSISESVPRAPQLLRWRRWIWILGIVLLMAGGLMAVDRWIRPPAPVTADVEIVSVSDTQPNRRNSVTDALLEPAPPDAHPLDAAIAVAEAGLEYFRANVRDYRAVFIKQERVGGRMSAEDRSIIKFRQHGIDENGNDIPQAVYMRFIEPKSAAGREVIYVEGWNNGRLVAHEGGLLNVVRANLIPTSRLAMRGNKHPITEFGIEKLLMRMIASGKRDRERGMCQVLIDRNIEVNGHLGTEIKIIHPEKVEPFDFHIGRIIIDDELNVPVGFEGYLWPEKPGDPPILNERYFYNDLELNVGLTDADFDPDNPDYDYP